MVNKLITFSIVLVVFLAACQSAPANPTAAPEDQVQPEQTDIATPSAELPPLPEVSPTPTDGQSANQAEANCTVVSREPTPGPTEQSLIPPVSETDWVHGPEDAKVTIIEYGDFQ